MKLVRIVAKNFRSFTAAQQLDFTGMQPGLYHVTGINEVEPDLEGNGAGKSSLFEAVCWALYGRTSRGLRAGNVRNWAQDKEPACTVIDAAGPAGAFQVLRTWGPNRLDLDGAPVTQDAVDRAAGMPFDAFLYSVYFAQFMPAFVDLPPAAQTELFTQVLDLQLWEEAAARASALAATLDGGLQHSQRQQAHLHGRAQTLAQQNFADEELTWNRKRDQTLAEMDAGIEQLKDQQQALTKQIAKLTRERDAGRAAAAEVDAAYPAVAEAEAACRQMQRQLTTLEAQNITHCPVCGEPVDRRHLRAETVKLEKALTASLRESAAVRKQFDALRTRAADLDREDALRAAAQQQSKLATEHHMMEVQAEKLAAEHNPYTAQRERADTEGEQIVSELEALAATIRREERSRTAAQFWSKGFKEVRLMQIREAIDQLTIEANEVLFQLGLHDWAIEFDVERETKSGTIAKHFNVLIRAPHVKGAVPWEAWSGGESQRLRLSIAMGFANLIASRAGVQPNVEFWDEPSTWLSAAGIEALLTALADRAARHGRIILLADHRSLDFGGFTGTVTVRKTAAGSLIEI